MDDFEIRIPASTLKWLQKMADRDHGGDVGAAAAAILIAAEDAERAPEDPWAGMDSRMRSRAPR